MNDIRVVAFDCDGVLFESGAANRAYYNHFLERFGRPPMTDDQFHYVHMHTVEESLAHLFPEPAALAAARAFRKTVSYIPFLKFMEIEPDLKPLLERLGAGFHTAIATNRMDTMGPLLEAFGLAHAFDLVVTACDVAHPKPHPEALLRILSHFGVSAGQMLYVGDSIVDEQAARAARVPMAAYNNRSLQADYHIRRLGEIAAILENGNAGREERR